MMHGVFKYTQYEVLGFSSLLFRAGWLSSSSNVERRDGLHHHLKFHREYVTGAHCPRRQLHEVGRSSFSCHTGLISSASFDNEPHAQHAECHWLPIVTPISRRSSVTLLEEELQSCGGLQ